MLYENDEIGQYHGFYCDFISETELLLTSIPTKISNWEELIEPKGVSNLNGLFTVNKKGISLISFERIYQNNDQNPAEEVLLTVDLRVNGESYLKRTLPMSPAGGPNDPSILAFTSPGVKAFTKGDEVEIYVSATDDGETPQEVKIIQARLVIKG